MKEKLERYLQAEGFFPLTSKISDVTVLIKFEHNLVNILQIIDYAKELYLDTSQYEEVKASLRKMFQDRGISEIHILSLILSADEKKSEALAKDDPFCWQIHTETKELLIGEDKHPDFYGVRGILENFLTKYREDPTQFDVSKEEPKKLTPKEKCMAYLTKAPYVTISIIAINLILCFCCIINPKFFYGKGSLSLSYILEGEVYRLVTAIFLHGGFDHYFSNMFLLYFLGDMVENKVGRVRFALLYLLTGILGNVASCLYEYYTDIHYISYGASGAVFGIIGVLFYLVMQRDKRLRVPVPSMLFMVGYCVYSSLVDVQVNEMAHLGGLLSGMLLMVVFFARRKSHEG